MLWSWIQYRDVWMKSESSMWPCTEFLVPTPRNQTHKYTNLRNPSYVCRQFKQPVNREHTLNVLETPVRQTGQCRYIRNIPLWWVGQMFLPSRLSWHHFSRRERLFWRIIVADGDKTYLTSSRKVPDVFLPILNKFGFSSEIPNIKFYGNPFSGSRPDNMRTDRRTWRSS